ncbi:ribonuclease Z mitochondrial precursor [Phyllosticta citrichinensis]|uniref:ribonuclease Z n=1 Tax=Phyllosticta citrichinensis TaxID=1130410 RepID=A0ABR1Y8R8_9PEZI
MKASLRVVSTPTADTPSTMVVLNSDSKQYMIGNMGEAMQRTMTELGVRLVKTHDFFLTGRSEWRSLGGLLGMTLTKADQLIASNQDKSTKGSGEPVSLNVIGPPNLNYTIATTRRVIFKRGMPLNTFEVTDDPPKGENQELLPSYVDENIRLYPMSVSPLRDQPSPASSTSSGKKRSHDEMNDAVSTSKPNGNEKPPSAVSQNPAQVAKEVVSNMFNSTWSLDALFETRFSEVKLPAKLFWRAPGSNKIGPFDWSAAKHDPIVLAREPWPATKVASLPPVEPALEAVSYLIKTCDIRGKFDGGRADALNVPRGAERGKLALGQTIQLKNGDTITSDMVMGPSRVGMALAVIDLPSVDYVKPLISRSEWEFPEIKDNLQLIVWTLGPGVASDPVLKSFMESLPRVKHLVSSQDLGSNQIIFKKSAGSILRMSHADEKRFKESYSGNPILSHTTYESFQPESSITLAQNAEPIELLIPLGTGSAMPSLYRNVSATLVRVPGYGSYLLDCGEGTFGQLQRAFEPAKLIEIFKDLRMIYLSHPHADHILGIIPVIKAWYNIVHKGRRSSQNARQALDSIRRNPESAGATKRLAIVASQPLHGWLAEYSGVEDFGYSQIWPVGAWGGQIELVRHGEGQAVPKSLWEPLFGLQDLRTCFVHHCHNAQAVSLTWPDATRADQSAEDSKPFKVSYSGDCRPNYNQFTEIGRHSTLLIHEATFEDGLLGDAKAKRHSTTSEALAVGARMRAKCVLLTHFSQRYQKLPVMQEGQQDDNAMDVDGPPEEAAGFFDMVDSAEGITLPKEVAAVTPAADEPAAAPAKIVVKSDMRVGFASDLMRIKMGEFAELEYFVPAMEKLFAEEAKEEVEAGDGVEAEEEASKSRAQPNGKGKGNGNGNGNGKNANAAGGKQQIQKQKGNRKGNGGKAQQGVEEV